MITHNDISIYCCLRILLRNVLLKGGDAHLFHSIFYIYGANRTGKSQIVSLLQRLAQGPTQEVSFLESSFSAASLVEICLIHISEITLLKDLVMKTLKMVSGGDKLRVEKKYKQEVVSEKINASIVITSNYGPETISTTILEDPGLQDRLVLVHFIQAYILPEEKVQVNFSQRIPDTIISELALWALSTEFDLLSLCARGKFLNKGLCELSNDVIEDGDPVNQFIETALGYEENCFTPFSNIYQAFINFYSTSHFDKSEKQKILRKFSKTLARNPSNALGKEIRLKKKTTAMPSKDHGPNYRPQGLYNITLRNTHNIVTQKREKPSRQTLQIIESVKEMSFIVRVHNLLTLGLITEEVNGKIAENSKIEQLSPSILNSNNINNNTNNLSISENAPFLQLIEDVELR